MTNDDIREEWRKLRPAIGDLICHMDGQIDRLGEIEQVWQKGYEAGYSIGVKEGANDAQTIHSGDQVEAFDLNEWVRFIAWYVDDDSEEVIGIDANGGRYLYPLSSCRKTGRHYHISFTPEDES